LQSFSEDFQATFQTMTNKTYIPYTNPATGEQMSFYYIKSLGATEVKFQKDIECAITNGSMRQYLDEEGNTVYTTQGYMNSAATRATPMTYGGSLDVTFYSSLVQQLRKGMSGKDFLGIHDLNFGLANAAFSNEFSRFKNSGVSPDASSIMMNLKEVSYSGFNFSFHENELFSDPLSFGAQNVYDNTCLFVPKNAVYDNGAKSEVYPLTLLYKSFKGSPVSKDWYSFGTLGFLADNGATDSRNSKRFHYKAEVGVRSVRCEEWVLARA
jgi:hypothetical protein